MHLKIREAQKSLLSGNRPRKFTSLDVIDKTELDVPYGLLSPVIFKPTSQLSGLLAAY